MVRKLELITGAQPQPDPGRMPHDLGVFGRRLWEAVQSEFGICDCGGITLLEQACRACDRAERCRLLIDSEGEVIKSGGGALREHPLLRAELQNRAFITRTLARLGITDEPVKPMGRPPILGR